MRESSVLPRGPTLIPTPTVNSLKRLMLCTAKAPVMTVKAAMTTQDQKLFHSSGRHQRKTLYQLLRDCKVCIKNWKLLLEVLHIQYLSSSGASDVSDLSLRPEDRTSPSTSTSSAELRIPATNAARNVLQMPTATAN